MDDDDFLGRMEKEVEDTTELCHVPTPTLRSVTAYTDDTMMPFGKHRGSLLKHVPATYLLWWLEQGGTNYPELLAYILKNENSLEQEKQHERRKKFKRTYNQADYDEDSYDEF